MNDFQTQIVRNTREFKILIVGEETDENFVKLNHPKLKEIQHSILSVSVPEQEKMNQEKMWEWTVEISEKIIHFLNEILPTAVVDGVVFHAFGNDKYSLKRLPDYRVSLSFGEKKRYLCKDALRLFRCGLVRYGVETVGGSILDGILND